MRPATCARSSPNITRHVDVAFRGWNDAWLDPGFKAWNIEDAVGRWRVPALLIQGADDQYGTLKQIRAIEARSPAPVTSLILEACRHSPQVDQPQATLEAIVPFCATTDKVTPCPSEPLHDADAFSNSQNQRK